MAEGIARQVFAERAIPAEFSSTGIRADGSPIAGRAVELLARRGIDMADHRGALLTAEAMTRADLVIAMARRHAREAVLLDPQVLPRTFTLRELVRRGDECGGRPPGVPVRAWAAGLAEGRRLDAFLGTSSRDDIADPYGQGTKAYQKVIDQLDGLIRSLADLVDPTPEEGQP